MAEEYTCIECECLYDNTDGNTDERMCNKCLDGEPTTADEHNNKWLLENSERRDPNIQRSSTVHYPDWDMKKKKYVVPKQRKEDK